MMNEARAYARPTTKAPNIKLFVRLSFGASLELWCRRIQLHDLR